MTKLLNFFKRLQLRAQMRETARRIELTNDALAQMPARKLAAESEQARKLEQLDAEARLLQEEADELWQRATRLREDYFWVGRSRHQPFSYCAASARGASRAAPAQRDNLTTNSAGETQP
jgi:hypothetical protein